jgi:hypothetical protein
MVCSYRCPSLNSERRASIVVLADWLPMRKTRLKRGALTSLSHFRSHSSVAPRVALW